MNDISAPVLLQDTENRSPDLVKILWRWKWLPILGGLVGSLIGYFYFSKMVPKYVAGAVIKVESPAKEVPINSFERGQDTRSHLDEIVVIQSPLVLKQAIEIGLLTQQRKLAGMSVDEIVGFIKRPKVLDVKLGSADLKSDIIKIAVTTDDAELSGEIVKAIVNGYEQFVTSKFKGYSKEALATLSKFSQEYEKRRDDARKELDKLKLNQNLIWIDGKPRDPVAEKIVSYNEKILEIDSHITSIEAILQQVTNGRQANRSVEELLRMVTSSSKDSGFKLNDDSDVTMQRDMFRNKIEQVELFEQNSVIPLRAELELLNEQSLGDSHPLVISTRNKLTKLEDELRRRKAGLREAEEAYGAVKTDAPSLENRLDIATGVLKETLQKSMIERDEYKAKVESLRPMMQENQATISSFAINLADLEAVSAVASKISENLGKLSLGTEYGQKTVTKLDVQERGGFSGPFSLQYIGVGAVLGIIAFSSLAYLLELANKSYRSPDEIATDLGMPIIGHLPQMAMSRADRTDEKVDSSIVTLHKNQSQLSEAFRGVRTALFFSCQQGKIKVLQVTSPVPGDGKSTLAANIAVSMAQSGRRVCIIDCDFRRPRLAKMFGLNDETGMVQVIGGKLELDEAIQPTTVENLSAITCGRRPINPAELLSSEVFGKLVSELKTKFDFVIIDTPPMLAVSDPAIVAGHVDGVVLTIRLRRNLKPIALRAAQMLHAINANLIGVVVNGIDVRSNGYGNAGYRYDNYNSSRSGYGKNGYGGYGYGSTFQYGGYYSAAVVGRDNFETQPPISKNSPSSSKT